MNLETVIDDLGSTLQKISKPGDHPAYSHICHTPTFKQAKVKLEGHRTKLLQVREQLKSLWQQAESRIQMANKVEKYKDKAEKVIFPVTYQN